MALPFAQRKMVMREKEITLGEVEVGVIGGVEEEDRQRKELKILEKVLVAINQCVALIVTLINILLKTVQGSVYHFMMRLKKSI